MEALAGFQHRLAMLAVEDQTAAKAVSQGDGVQPEAPSWPCVRITEAVARPQSGWG